MTHKCKAKDPNSCRVHGTPDSIQNLEVTANSAVSSKDLNSYLDAKEKMDEAKVVKRVDLQDAKNTKRFQSAPLYRKSAIVAARRTETVEHLSTVLSNGTVETTREVPAGEWIVTNPGGEEYAITDEKFQSRYEAIGDGQYQATGIIRAFKNPTGGDVEIMAPWGEMQYGDANCWFATGTDGELNPTKDCYIIGGDELKDTYKSYSENPQEKSAEAKLSTPKKAPVLSKRERLLAKAEEFAGASEGSVEEEARYILLELAGDSEEDMFSEAGTDDMLASLEREEGSVEAKASALVYKLLK